MNATELDVAIASALDKQRQLAEETKDQAGARELSLVRTKLEEARLWLGAARMVSASG